MIEIIKELVINAAVMIIFISVVEIIAPDNKMKKYVSFVLGIIFIAVLINPIIKLTKEGRGGIEEAISRYEYDTKKYEKNNLIEAYKKNETSPLNKQFEKNLSNQSEEMLKKKFPNMNFQCRCTCECNSDYMSYDIKNITVYVNDGSVQEIKRVDISINEKTESIKNEYKEIVQCLMDELQISADKINVYKMENKEDLKNGKSF